MEYDFTIIIPAYNEEKTIRNVLYDLKSDYGEQADIIVVNDGSTDKTAQIVKEIPGIRLINHKFNEGYGASLKTGILMSRTENICFFDADAQHASRDIRPLMEEIETFDMVIGARGIDAYKTGFRAPGKIFLYIFSAILLGKTVLDLNSGLRAVKKSILWQYIHLLPDSFSASSTMTLIFLFRRYHIKYIPISVNKRIGTSTLKIFNDGLRVIVTLLRVTMRYNPLRIFIPPGIIFTVIGFLYGFYIFLTGPSGLSVGAFLLIFLGVIFFMFGFIGDQIATIRTEGYEDLEILYKSRIR